MAFDINNFVIDRIVRGVALSQKDDSVLFSINQIQNASLNCASVSYPEYFWIEKYYQHHISAE